MLLLSPEEAAVFELLDPSTSRRLVVGRTGRAFVWDPISSTREVPFQAAQSLVKAGVVGPGGRIAAEHLGQWRKPGARPGKPVAAARLPAPQAQPAMQSSSGSFERTVPLGYSSEALRAM